MLITFKILENNLYMVIKILEQFLTLIIEHTLVQTNSKLWKVKIFLVTSVTLIEMVIVKMKVFKQNFKLFSFIYLFLTIPMLFFDNFYTQTRFSSCFAMSRKRP